MDLYIVDETWTKTDIIDSFNSLIWTERYNDSGDVTLTLPASAANRALITEGIFLHTPVSRDIMLIDTISIEDNVLTATGRSLTDFLKYRMFRSSWQTGTGNWPLSGLPMSQSMGLLLNAVLSPTGYLTSGTVLTAAQGTNETFSKLTIAPYVPGPNLSAAVPYGDMFTAMKTMADLDSLGFILYPPSVNDGSGNLTFLTYRGVDRTTSQSVNGQVIFDPAIDTLVNVKEVRSKSGYRNVCWVWPNNPTAQSQVGVAYAPGAQTLSGWKRQSMMLIADDINIADYSAANLPLVLAQRGVDALANNNYVRLLDGQIVPQNAYAYGVDYNLGDIIELRGTTNVSQAARITEYIRSQDSTGENSYPTLSVI